MPTSVLGSLRGAALPRVRLAPEAAYGFGVEACELSRRAGLPPDDWQADALGVMLSVRSDGKWSCFEYGEMCPRQNGKTAGIFGPRALAGLFLVGEMLIMWSAHEYKTAMESFRLVRNLISELGKSAGKNLIDVDGIPVKVNNTNGEEGFERLDTGQRVKFIARSKGSGRGFSGDANLFDEAFALTRLQQDALMPTILARPNPQIGYASSPPLDGESGEVLFALRERVEAGDAGLGWRDWGIGGDLDHLEGVDLDDRRLWAAANPSMGLRANSLTEEKILRCRSSMSDVGFAREILGVWPRQSSFGGGVIDPVVWAGLADAGSQVSGSVVFAAAANPEHTRATIGVAGRRADGAYHVEVIDCRDGSAWVPGRLAELVERWEPPVGPLVDPAGPGGAWLTALAELRVVPELVTGREMAQACGAFYDGVVERGDVRHLNQPELNAALAGAKQRVVGDVWVWHRRDSTVDVSPLEAGSLALHGAVKHAGVGAPNLWV